MSGRWGFVSRTFRWLQHNPLSACLFFGGAAVGAALSAPLIGWKLPDSTATIFGAFLGAAVSVYGAVFAVELQARKRESLLLDTLMAIVMRPWSVAQSSYMLTDFAHPNDCIDAISRIVAAMKLAVRAAERIAAALPCYETELAISELNDLLNHLIASRGGYERTASTDSLLTLGREIVRNSSDQTMQGLESLKDRIKYRDAY